jgi:hypothetical protein
MRPLKRVSRPRSSLKTLQLSNNPLELVPDVIFALTSLEKLGGWQGANCRGGVL